LIIFYPCNLTWLYAFRARAYSSEMQSLEKHEHHACGSAASSFRKGTPLHGRGKSPRERSRGASNVSRKVIDSAGSRCRNLCRLHLRIINTCAIAESRSARMAERSANSSADIVCTLLHRRSRLCFRSLLSIYRSVSASVACTFF